MPTVFIDHRVEDFDKWQEMYVSVAKMQQAGGVISDSVFRAADDPNQIRVVHRFATSEEAHRFVESNPDLQAAMERGGVISSSVRFEFYDEA